MKQLVLIGYILAILCNVYPQNPLGTEKYSQVTIDINKDVINTLNKFGIPMDYNQSGSPDQFTGVLSGRDLNILVNENINFQVLIPDYTAYIRNRNSLFYPDGDYPSDPLYKINSKGLREDPKRFKLGSMGGFLNFEEMKRELDSMAILYPHIITQPLVLDTLTTYEGRSLFYLKMSDNPGVKENEPEILFTALHHSREPLSLQQLIYFMWYLLENYTMDSEIKYLIDNAELYFVPCVNPDGYNYVSTSEPLGGSMWRKNRRKLGDTTFGVDLNRNYDMAWGVSGSSTDPSSEIYHGPTPFSEPETRALKSFTERHKFLFAMNHHSFGEILFFPYGYEHNTFTPHHSYFLKFANEMAKKNRYDAGTVINYTAGGLSDDWFYDNHGIFSYTPESGPADEGFWPAPDRILPHIRNTLEMNLTASKIILRPEINLVDGNEYNPTVRFDVMNKSSIKPMDIEIKFSNLQKELTIYNRTRNYQFDSSISFIGDSLSFALDPLPHGTKDVYVEANVQYGPFSYTDTLSLSLNVNHHGGRSKVNWSGLKTTTHPTGITLSVPGFSIPSSTNIQIMDLKGSLQFQTTTSSVQNKLFIETRDWSGSAYILLISNCTSGTCKALGSPQIIVVP